MMSSKTQTLEMASPSSQTAIFYLLCAGFFVNGIIISFIGPILPVFMARWGLDDSHAGLFSLAQFSGAFAGVLVSSALISAKGFKPAVTLGLALLGIGFALLNAPTFPLALAASGIYGLGYGFATPGTNLWVGESYGDRRASALSIINLAWGAGAISSSPLAMLSMRASRVSLALYVVGGLCAALAIVLLRMSFGKTHVPEDPPAATAVTDTTARTGVAALLGILFFVYVGTEVGTSYWAPVHAQRAAAWSSNAWTLAPMFFFTGLLIGRGAAAGLLLRFRETTIAIGALLLAAIGESIFLAARSRQTLFGGAFLAGLGLASLFPIFIAWLSKWFGTGARKVGGLMFALGSLGSALIPPLVGVVSRYAGSLRVGLVVPLAGCAVMLTVIALLRPGRRG
jgi:MFS transporter, FHS family, glucose/mannose:H+ symporter